LKNNIAFACRGCGTERVETPMLKDELWKLVSPAKEVEVYKQQIYAEHGVAARDVLCLDCVEKRLGRTVYCEDLNSSLWSDCIKAFVKRELERARAGG
jgi:hypothetical protein